MCIKKVNYFLHCNFNLDCFYYWYFNINIVNFFCIKFIKFVFCFIQSVQKKSLEKIKTLENEEARLKAKMMEIIPKQKESVEKLKKIQLNEIKLTKENKAYIIEIQDLKSKINSLKEMNAIQSTKIEDTKQKLAEREERSNEYLDSYLNQLETASELREMKWHLFKCLERKNKKIKDLKEILNLFPQKDFEEKKREIEIADLKYKQYCKKHQKTETSLQTSTTNSKEKQIIANKSDTKATEFSIPDQETTIQPNRKNVDLVIEVDNIEETVYIDDIDRNEMGKLLTNSVSGNINIFNKQVKFLCIL